MLSIIFFTGCKKEVSELEFEKNVMTEIFPSLIDETCIDKRLYLNPPPKYGKYIYDENGNNIEIDTTKATEDEKKKMSEWKNEIDKIEKDTSKLIVAFNPILKKNKENIKEDFEKHFPNIKLKQTKTEKKSDYTFEYQNIKLNSKFKLKNISEFPKDRDAFWKTKYKFVFSGVVEFTRIQFDNEKKYGILDGGFICGRLCGQGFRIYIKKKNNKWIIDKIEGTWIS